MKLRMMGIITAILIAAGCYFGYRYYLDVIKPEQQIAAADAKQLQLFESIRPSLPSVQASRIQSDSLPDAEIQATDYNYLADAEKVNSSVVGWITIPGTHIDYPIVQGEDNEFYLYHGFDGKLNQRLGCPFLDYRCPYDFSGLNSIVYAHHMTRQRMFADVARYQDSSFMESCPEGMLLSKNGQRHVRFFAYLTVPSDSLLYQAEFGTEAERMAYIDFLFENAKYTTGYSPDTLKNTEQLHLLLLSTCTFEYQEARGVLVGVIE